MFNRNTRFFRFVAIFTCSVLLETYATAAVQAGVEKVYDAHERYVRSQPKAQTPSRILSSGVMKSFQGKAGTNPYASGQAKWDVVYKGVNLRTGNYSMSATDLTFEGGYGIPVNVTRSYSSNNAEEGPLGIGWNLSVDVRSTAGGILKSKGSPVASVPTNFKSRHTAQLNDPNAESATGTMGVQPAEAIIATDAGGTDETIQVDADGIITTPPWDKNTNDTEWEMVVDSGGSVYRVMKHNVTHTAEGTNYVYDKMGTYINGGTRPYDQPAASPEPSNVLKITSAVDRQGNTTTYTYAADMVNFVKLNGTTSERKLSSIQMPNGHVINFTWTGSRITKASDGVRDVNYVYENGLLKSVTTPGGKTTSYTYAAAGLPVGNYTGDMAYNLLNTITDPRGLTTEIQYYMHGTWQWPIVGFIHAPNGVSTEFGFQTYPESEFTLIPGTVRDFVRATGAGTNQFITYAGNYSNDIYQIGISSSNELISFAHVQGTGMINRFFRRATQDLVQESTIAPRMASALSTDRLLDPPGTNFSYYQMVNVERSYNFMGNPLKTEVTEYNGSQSSTIAKPMGNWSPSHSSVTDTAYWGASKYYQKKADKQNDDANVRYSFTDYYPNTAVPGKRGQTYRVYDQARATFSVDHTGQPAYPYGTNASFWRYDIHVVDPSKYSAQFDYDSKGRATDVWKIQDTSVTPWKYVQTHTVYGDDGSPSWGAANDVWEDYGSGGINRHTQTQIYDSIGRAVQVVDASGKTFHTTYDLDGVIQSIEQISGNTTTPVVTYSYGTTPNTITFGAVLSVTDNISGRTQAMSYYTNASDKFSLGQVASVLESGSGFPSYSTSYTYNENSERSTATYTTPNGTHSWGYTDYAPVGDPTKGSRAFQTMRKLDGNGNPTAEEFHYEFDASGRLREAAFALTPKDNWTPSGSNSWYDHEHRAKSRARAHYTYDDGGRPLGVDYFWDTISQDQSTYTSTYIRGNSATYETSGLNRGLKLTNSYWVPSANGPVIQRTESYGYDAQRDYLTSANYGDGLANQNVSWTYDAAGNRASDSAQSGTWTYDNLNRMTASPSATYVNDILGNRTSRTNSGGPYASHTMTWDILNRMTGYNSVAYAYRADGMRTWKGGSTYSTYYRYDGQTGIQDVEVQNQNTVVTDYGLGARGIDVMLLTESGSTSVGYPVYDLHGNMVATIAKSGSGWSIGNERSFDAWGNVRSGSGVNTGRYCANLGHKQDDESGLTYMRARYYEGTSGRFVSEDTAIHGENWFNYCSNDPLNRVDKNGQADEWYTTLALLGGVGVFSAVAIQFANKANMVAALAFLFLALLLAERILNGLEFTAAQMSERKDLFTSVKFMVPLTAALVAANRMSTDVRTRIMGIAMVAYTVLIVAAVMDAILGE